MQATEPKQADGGVQARTGPSAATEAHDGEGLPGESTSGDQSKE